ncbi:MAG: N-acetyl-gamma-glutamyl-phosphate reductase [Sodalis sp.]|nr:MAG: N-acetyl-gamma-glutamyl-phosphate reductase [Sodalis sp.]
MLNMLIVDASGYRGAERALHLACHSQMNLAALMVSAQSADAGKLLSKLHPRLKGII